MLNKPPIITTALSYSSLSSVTCTLDAWVNKLCFSLVNSSFKTLICRATANKPKTGKGKQVMFFLAYTVSLSLFLSPGFTECLPPTGP